MTTKKRSYAPDDIFSRRLQLAFIGRHPIFVMGMRFVPLRADVELTSRISAFINTYQKETEKCEEFLPDDI